MSGRNAYDGMIDGIDSKLLKLRTFMHARFECRGILENNQ